MVFKRIWRRHFGVYAVTMCIFYFMMVFIFLTGISPQRTRDSNDDQSVAYIGDILQMERQGGMGKSKDKKYQHEVGDPRRLVIVDSTPTLCVGKQTEDDLEFKKVFPDVFIYSAFFDARDNDFEARENGSTAIRFMAILPIKLKPETFPKLYCVGLMEPGLYWSVPVTFYEMCENHNMRYGGYILSCKLPKELSRTPPCSVLVSPKTVPTNSSEWFKVHSSTDIRKNRFEVCVPPLFGKIDDTNLIAFIELARMFGAERIHFYNHKVSPSVLAVLSYYRELGVVSVLPWKLDSRFKNTKRLHYNGQSVSIQDCLYRNMFSTQFLAFMDIDEMFVPKNHTNWVAMITSLANYSQYAGFSVSSAFFDPKWRPEVDSFEVKLRMALHTLTDVIRTKQLSRYRTKCIVDPRRIFELGIHHVSKPVMATLQTIQVPDDYVLLHHYRNCDPRFGMKCRYHVRDETLLTYADKLESAVRTVQASIT